MSEAGMLAFAALIAAVCSSCSHVTPACVIPNLCASACDAVARPSPPPGAGLLGDACNCAVDCDLGTCHGAPVCPP